jgi:beta-lactam-binding protein with PASTA domain
VWVGSPETPYEMPDYWGYSVFGGSVAAPIWKAYMLQVMENMRPLDFRTAELTAVPSVVGHSREEAIAILKQAGFKIDATLVDSYLPAGTVAEQTPSAGSHGVAGAIVHLGISNGHAPSVTLPALKGTTLDAARAALAALHISVVVDPKKTTDKKLDGTVVGMSPSAGSTVLQGSSVTLTVLALEAGPSPSPSQ